MAQAMRVMPHCGQRYSYVVIASPLVRGGSADLASEPCWWTGQQISTALEYFQDGNNSDVPVPVGYDESGLERCG